MSKVTNFVCQKAAQAVIADLGPLRLSADGLEAVNEFMGEFLFILLSHCKVIDIVQIRSVVDQQLLSNSLGKLALIEADLELKKLLKATPADFKDYDSSRISDIQRACADHCTLSDHKHSSSDIIVVYLTAIVEHLAEYLLNSIADRTDGEYICIKEVFAGFSNDTNIKHVFQKMRLKDKLQKKTSFVQLNSPDSAFVRQHTEKEKCALEQKSQEDKSVEFSRKNSLKKRLSIFGNKKNRPSTQPSPLLSPSSSPLATDFEDLFRSGDTKRVSLTPLRLKSIEVSPVLPPDSPPATPSIASVHRLEELGNQTIPQRKRPERPSIRVLKRASEGTRPLSFQEDTVVRGNYPIGQEKTIGRPELVYVLPSMTPWRQKLKKDQACQTDPLDCFYNTHEQERRVVEWLMGV